MKFYIGIDNGLDGGIAIISSEGQLLATDPMPTISNGKKRQTSSEGVVLLLGDYGDRFIGPQDSCFVLYERPAGSQNVSAAVSMQDSFARIDTVLMMGAFARMALIANDWQGSFWKKPKMPKGVKFDTKAAAAKAAHELWPDHCWLKTERCKTPHDGMIDAALIAEFGRRQNY